MGNSVLFAYLTRKYSNKVWSPNSFRLTPAFLSGKSARNFRPRSGRVSAKS